MIFLYVKSYGERLWRASSLLDAVFNVGISELGFLPGPPASHRRVTIWLPVSLDQLPLSSIVLFKSLILDLKQILIIKIILPVTLLEKQIPLCERFNAIRIFLIEI